MVTTTPLEPISLPLASTSLIEASAGTGKTYTMVSLYLRLLLQAGENPFPQLLTVEQILVVTFTKDATQELRERIRCRIKEVKHYFQLYQQQDHCLEIEQDPFLQALVNSLKHQLPQAIARLQLAEQSMDRAAIFTIHGFCQRMLLQFAFDSGIHFNLEMNPDNQSLLQRLSKQLWREQFYALSPEQAEIIYTYFSSPDKMVERLKTLLTGELPKLSEQASITSLTELIQHISTQTTILKKLWQEQKESLTQWFEQHSSQLKYTLGNKNKIFTQIFPQLDQWAESNSPTLPKGLLDYFTQEKLDSSIKKNASVPSHPFFTQISQLQQNYNEHKNQQLANYFYAKLLRQKLFAYRANHSDKGFDDLLRLLKDSLSQPQGKRLAELIHHQYPFAMIDEFQDTDPQQFAIFNQIYLSYQADHAHHTANGFIMIGDPKQAIYRFRGADIFTYFQASSLVKHRFTLDKNWRSNAELVKGINQLFQVAPQSFKFDKIDFQPVKYRDDILPFKLKDQIQAPLVIYQSPAEKLSADNYRHLMAENCANSIQQWLKLAENNQAFLGEKKLQAKDIAILVRTSKEADIIRASLLRRGIASVYLSERTNIFQTNTAKELLLLLQACLNPFNERAMLSALATSFFCLTSAELHQLHQDEKCWDLQVERFLRYQQIWHWQGVLPMLYQLFNNEQIPTKLQSRQTSTVLVENERTLTDLLHLAELLQQAARLNRNETALVRWYQQQLLQAEKGETDGKEEQQLRLESELELVKVVTIHKSKGLEYGIVWLPFIGLDSDKKHTQAIPLYHDNNDNIIWSLNDAASDAQQNEILAENLRLLYVALTRAKYQIALGLPHKFPDKTNCSALAYLLRAQTEENYATRLANSLSDIRIEIHAAEQQLPDPWRPQHFPQQQLQAKDFHNDIDRNWQVSSFTQLQQLNQRHHQQLETTRLSFNFLDEAKEYDTLFMPSMSENISETSPLSYPQGYSPLDLPSNQHIGITLHTFLEKCDFQRPLEQKQLQQLALSLNLITTENLADNDENILWLTSLEQWLNHILSTPLTPTTISLNQITKTDRLNELDFFLKIPNSLFLDQFNHLLQQHHRIADLTKPLVLEDLNGFIRGFIDLIFRHQGKYYLIDYKSNFLGKQANDYSPLQLDQVIAEYRYDLQYLIYTLALHRYLRQRDPNYQYQRDFGGVFYLFLRGMDPNNPGQGIFFDKPSATLIEALDQLWGDN
ncbi:exodeoxyribonuclease V subunit beta [Mergibacter septicus]|uniref:RecBCD enzyme subunit RecB n=1 Tax=Mergibacter septicus TaxID=221402 RepID=A0A8E3MHG6_9PAST|nr:exodeoxyribonuclease V subunit beta [Mergibacter septicus]AWX15973.1 exodeoxyribonuclease V subunit beta [Mergibacter septicus]QDJ15226.1 exodeoxyribonuclease V subunit beta [Mergibacter septicus]UTU47354.1 exodeoxyribonuclease V subunit beta [Mergibacter septicus]WMR95466.1 exodeoxyribonuclease V subunit beta [Mergibacter septicus]